MRCGHCAGRHETVAEVRSCGEKHKPTPKRIKKKRGFGEGEWYGDYRNPPTGGIDDRYGHGEDDRTVKPQRCAKCDRLVTDAKTHGEYCPGR
jgi:hypothetical protein